MKNEGFKPPIYGLFPLKMKVLGSNGNHQLVNWFSPPDKSAPRPGIDMQPTREAEWPQRWVRGEVGYDGGDPLNRRALSIQVCPKKGINPTILLWGWDWYHQTYSREGYGSLGGYHGNPRCLPFVKVMNHPYFGSVYKTCIFHGLLGSKGRKIAMGFF